MLTQYYWGYICHERRKKDSKIQPVALDLQYGTEKQRGREGRVGFLPPKTDLVNLGIPIPQVWNDQWENMIITNRDVFPQDIATAYVNLAIVTPFAIYASTKVLLDVKSVPFFSFVETKHA